MVSRCLSRSSSPSVSIKHRFSFSIVSIYFLIVFGDLVRDKLSMNFATELFMDNTSKQRDLLAISYQEEVSRNSSFMTVMFPENRIVRPPYHPQPPQKVSGKSVESDGWKFETSKCFAPFLLGVFFISIWGCIFSCVH